MSNTIEPERILVLGGVSLSLLNFRGPLLKRLKLRGHEVVAAAPPDENAASVADTLESWGIRFMPVSLSRGSANPIRDWSSFCAIKRLLAEVRPNSLIAYTVKPVVYGGMAARSVGGVRFFPMITGLGYAFTEGAGLKRALLRQVVMGLYRRGLKDAEKVIFQNPDDQALFEQLGLVNDPQRSVRVYGSGVDRVDFPEHPLPDDQVFLMVARLVADKGVREYVEAARQVRERFPNTRFLLAGGLDPNPAGISQAEVDEWVAEGAIEYLGAVQPIQSVLAQCRYFVLPSYYREGTPRSVLEAMSTGRPIITTDAPGCRETVKHGRNGLLVPPRDSRGLADAMESLLQRPRDVIVSMSEESLGLVRERFDVDRVNDHLLSITNL
ncbi:glycosyltransferase family 4 protein [Chromohalobacter sp. 11-W]|uniref:glycosyltransferase family 4 protein n=1 Tax=Chromohalobacter sp. 11-W TaxID=2994061 RepID=UPI0024694AAA|nr:glycosyltransferase family 4 protein [Chromohalobacter sp. 11-W]